MNYDKEIPMTDTEYMKLAIEEAKKAEAEGEIPIGALVVYKDLIIATAHNEKEHTNDPTAHAEITALRKAARFLGTWRLTGASLYVTIEPCPMCAGALLNARVTRLIYGAPQSAVRSGGLQISPHLFQRPQPHRGSHLRHPGERMPGTGGYILPQSALITS